MAAQKGIKRNDALIVDPDLDTRMRLKSATTSVIQFGKVQLMSSISEAEGRMRGGDPLDVVFVHSEIEKEAIKGFISKSKKVKVGEDAAYVLVLKTSEQDSTTVAENVMIGADGFLFEPYSVDQLVEITELAAKVKKERSGQREAAALKFLIKDVMHQIDLMAYLKSAGYDVGRGARKLRKMCQMFGTLEGEKLELYYKLAAEMFPEAPFPQKIYQESYKGASSRVKKKMEQKLLAELEKDMGDEDEDGAAEEGGEATT